MDDNLKEEFSNKIVQLTKKVYLINYKNEENQALIDSIIRSYNIELNSTSKKLLKEINSLKEKNKNLISSYEEKYDKFVSSIKKTYDLKFKKIQSGYNSLKEEKKNLTNNINNEFDNKVKSMLSQVTIIEEECKKKFL